MLEYLGLNGFENLGQYSINQLYIGRAHVVRLDTTSKSIVTHSPDTSSRRRMLLVSSAIHKK